MSILIKGMKMPKNCRTCKLIDYDRGCYRCIVTTAPCDLNSKNENCPLVPVPPHGRLIDADAILKWFEGGREKLVKDGHGDVEVRWIMAFDTFISAVGDVPTIIPAEEGE